MKGLSVYSLIVPVYRNEGSIPDLLGAIEELHDALGGRLEAVFVVDGSPDRSAELLQALLPAQRFAARLVLLSRNFGAFAAIRVGLQHATGDHFAVMAADLQEPPELALEFFRTLAADEYDVVVGTREGRADPLGSRLAAGAFWGVYRRLVVRDMPAGGVDIFGCNRAFRDCLLACEEANTSLVALLFWLGFRRKQVAYTRRARVHGGSGWTLRKKVTYLMDSVFAFTDLPVRVLMTFGLTGLLVSLSLGVVVLSARLAGLFDVPGYAATILVVLFFGGINALGLGVVGSYAWRGYENTKRRPLAVAARELSYTGVTMTPVLQGRQR